MSKSQQNSDGTWGENHVTTEGIQLEPPKIYLKDLFRLVEKVKKYRDSLPEEIVLALEDLESN